MESAARWADAARAYHRLLTEHGDELVRMDAAHFVSVTSRVNQRVSKWPAAGATALEQWGVHALLLSSGTPSTQPASERIGWPQFGDSASRNSVGPAGIEPATLLWESPLPARTPLSPPVVFGDRVFVQDAARIWTISLNSGRLLWQYPGRSPADELSRMETTEDQKPSPSGRFGAVTDGRRVMAVLVTGIAEDAREDQAGGNSVLICVDARDGSEQWRLSASDAVAGKTGKNQLPWFDGPLLLHEGSIYAVLRRRTEFGMKDAMLVRCDVASGRPMWRRHLFSAAAVGRSEFDESSRTAAADDCVFVWTSEGLLACVNASTGRIRWITLTPAAAAPALKSTNPRERRDDLVLVSGPSSIRCYAAKDDGFARLQKRLATPSDDWEIELDVAGAALRHPALFVSGLTALETILSGGRNEQDSHRRRTAAFDLMLEIVESATQRTAAAPSTSRPNTLTDGIPARLADTLLPRVESIAGTPEQHVRYRLAFARLDAKLHRTAEAVMLCQQILEDRSLRLVPYPRGDAVLDCGGFDAALALATYSRGNPTRLAGEVAERQIAALIERDGRQVYQPYADRAEELFDLAIAAEDRDLLREVFEAFPLAPAAPRALLQLAEGEKQAARPREAIKVLRDGLLHWGRLKNKAPDFDELRAIRLLAESCFDAGDPANGLSWFARGRRDFPSATFTEDGRTETFATLREKYLKKVSPLNRQLPAVTPPLSLTCRRSFDEPLLILRPTSEAGPQAALVNAEDRAREDILISHGDTIELLDRATGQPQRSFSLPGVTAPLWLGARGDLLLFSGKFQLFGIEPSTGHTRWTFGRIPPRAESPAVDPEIFVPIVTQALGEETVIAVRKDNLATAVRVADGRIDWQRQLAHKCTGPIVMNDEHIIYPAVVSGLTSFVVLDAVTGDDIRILSRDDQREVGWIALSPERTLVAAGTNWIACFDPQSGRRVWSFEAPSGLQVATVQMGLEGLYFVQGDGSLAARSLTDGHEIRHSSPAPQGEVLLDVWLDGPQVYVVTAQSVTAWDARGRELRWSRDFPRSTRVDSAVLTRDTVVVFGNVDHHLRVYFTDRSNGRPMPPDRGDGIELGEDIRIDEVQAYEGAIAIRSGNTLWIWSGAPASTRPATDPAR